MSFWRYLFSPRLYKEHNPIYGLYKPNAIEKWADRCIFTVELMWKLGIYATPFVFIAIKNDYISVHTTKDVVNLVSLIGCIGTTYMGALLLRGIGRSQNPMYRNFVKTLYSPLQNSGQYLQELRKFDFEMYAWPVSYEVKTKVRVSSSTWLQQNPFKSTVNAHLPFYKRIFVQLIGYFVTHTFGIRMIYPGCFSLLKYLIMDQLLMGRSTLVEDFNGKRAKIKTADQNYIDTMFVDQRNNSSEKGKKLVICCEGNSGFYEIGIIGTAVKAGYSAVGWNHPGFAESTGLPYPRQEQFAIDAVMQYAINELGFQVKDIILFGWSIGGYPATWAAIRYPEIHSLILDATFDDLLPLATHIMPASWTSLVREVVRTHVNLNITELLTQYPYRFFTIRRTDDEIICLRQGQLSTNCLNNLLVSIIEHRHPECKFNREELEKYVNLRETERHNIERRVQSDEIKNIIATIDKYTIDVKGTHCVPLPDDVFEDVLNRVQVLQPREGY